MRSKESLLPGREKVGGVDNSGSNAGVRLTDEQAAPPTLSYRGAFWMVWGLPLIVGFVCGLLFSPMLAEFLLLLPQR